MSPQTHPFGASRQGAPNCFLAFILTTVAVAATVFTHHNPWTNSSAVHEQGLCSCHGKTFFISCSADSICFGNDRNFQDVKNFEDRTRKGDPNCERLPEREKELLVFQDGTVSLTTEFVG
jgi:hypothetical protein